MSQPDPMPILLKDGGGALQLDWDPPMFQKMFKNTPCDSQSCLSGDITHTTVGGFVGDLGSGVYRLDPRKVKVHQFKVLR